RLQCADLAVDGVDRGVGHGVGETGVALSLRHCEERSDEAIHLPPRGEVDCFASLAMTAAKLRQNSLVGQITKTCPAPSAKIFRLTSEANHRHNSARLTADEGRWP